MCSESPIQRSRSQPLSGFACLFQSHCNFVNKKTQHPSGTCGHKDYVKNCNVTDWSQRGRQTSRTVSLTFIHAVSDRIECSLTAHLPAERCLNVEVRRDTLVLLVEFACSVCTDACGCERSVEERNYAGCVDDLLRKSLSSRV